MSDNISTQFASDKQLEEGVLLLDESELEVKQHTVTRRKFSNMTKTVVLIRPNPDDWTEVDRIRVGTPNSLMAISSVLREVNIPVEILDFSVLNQEEEEKAIESILSNEPEGSFIFEQIQLIASAPQSISSSLNNIAPLISIS